ncbi:MAG: YSC84-related protein [Pseudomonadales bacterium]|jgi:lipid-binding SYLF domain-containing protein
MRLRNGLALTAVVLGLVLSAGAAADGYDKALEVFRQAGESGSYFDNCYGYALFPTIGKGGIGIGGAGGKGRVFVGGKHVGNTSMAQLTIGLQLGGQAYSMIIFFEDERAFNEFTSGNFEFGAQVAAVAITAGASASASTAGGGSAGASGGQHDAATAGGYSKGLAVFTVAKGGLMYEASLGGAKFNYTPVEG